MFNTIFLKLSNNKIPKIYTREIKETIKQADRYTNNIFIYNHPWDMERCVREVEFNYDWDMIPFGDPEWCFMLNRMRYLEILGRAYFFTNDEKYFFIFEKLITSWINKNKYPDKKRQTSWRRIDSGIRIEHWIKAIELFSKSKNFSKGLKNKIIESFDIHGRYLSKVVSSFSKTSNWGVLEFSGLFLLSLFCPELDKSKKWLNMSRDFLVEALDMQILLDNMQWECSPMYHNEVVHCYINFYIAAKRFNIKLDKKTEYKIKNIIELNAKIRKPDFYQLQWGDSDSTDLRVLMTTPAFIFNSPIMKSCAFDNLQLEDVCLLGIKAIEEYKKIKKENPKELNKLFENSGLVILRDDWSKNSSYINYISKKFGGGHNHDDLLHFSYYAKGLDYFIDSGRYSYVDSKEREYLKTSRGHNTIIINKRESSLYGGAWNNKTEGSFIGAKYVRENNIDLIYSYNLSYVNIGSVITRSIIKLDKENFLVLDAVSNANKTKKDIELKFNTPILEVQKLNGLIKIEKLNMYYDQKLKIEIKDFYYSPHYNEKLPSKQIVGNVSVKDNIIIANLFSFNKVSMKEVELTMPNIDKKIPSNTARGFNIVIDNDEYTILYRAFNNPTARAFFLGYKGVFYKQVYTILKNGELILEQ